MKGLCYTILLFLFVLLLVVFSPGDFDAATAEANITPLTWTHITTGGKQLPPAITSREQTSAAIFDVDGDGINDFVIGARRYGTPSLVWYRRHANGWTPYLIEPSIMDLEAGSTSHDIDGDGDLDLVVGGDQRSNQIWWWENPAPNFEASTGWKRRLIKSDGGSKHHDLRFGDFDGDGRDEFVFWNQNGKLLGLAEIPADPRSTQPWPYRAIYTWTDTQQEEGLAKADIDGDGVLDIIGGGKWFKYKADGRFTPNVIDATQRFGRAAAGQLIPGGRPEVVFGDGDGIGRLRWYEWRDNAWVAHDLLPKPIERGHSLAIDDLNQDGFLDIFVAEMRVNSENPDAGMWIFLGDGAGNFTRTDVAIGQDNHESSIGDLDGDGDLDILSKPYNYQTPRLDIWLNQLIPDGSGILVTLTPTPLPSTPVTGTPTSIETLPTTPQPCTPTEPWQRDVLDATLPWRTLFVQAGDLDGDGFIDLATGGWWFKNPGPAGGPWLRATIGAPLNNLALLHDLDGDGDLDVFGTQGVGSDRNVDFAWARNEGQGQFTIFTNIQSGQGDFLQGIAIGQFRNNATVEIALSWHKFSNGTQMLTVPAAPATDVWTWRHISPVSQDEALSAGDIDRDGDLDLLLGTQWLRNDQDPAGGPSTWRPFTLFATDELVDRSQLVDLNRDGRLDAVVGYERANGPAWLAWYEQPAESTAPWAEHLIAKPIGPMSLGVGDLDGDGDADLVVGEHYPQKPAAAHLYQYENVDGVGGSWTQSVIYLGDEHHSGAQLADLDQDGHLDVFSIGWEHRNLLRYLNPACDAPVPPTETPLPAQTDIPTMTATPTASATFAPPTATLLPGVTPPSTTPPTVAPSPQPSATPGEPPPSVTPPSATTPTVAPSPQPTTSATPANCPLVANNALQNGEFEEGEQGWKFYSNGVAAFRVGKPSYRCEAAAIVEITNAGTNVQLYQSGFPLEPSTHYRLSFAAYAKNGHDLAVYLHQHSNNVNYGLNNERFDLKEEWQTFAVNFTTSNFPTTTTDTRLRFWLAPFDEAGDVFSIDDVVLEKVESSAARQDPINQLLDQNESHAGTLQGRVQVDTGKQLLRKEAALTIHLSDVIRLGTELEVPLTTKPDGTYTIDKLPVSAYALLVEGQNEFEYLPSPAQDIDIMRDRITTAEHILNLVNALNYLPVIKHESTAQ